MEQPKIRPLRGKAEILTHSYHSLKAQATLDMQLPQKKPSSFSEEGTPSQGSQATSISYGIFFST